MDCDAQLASTCPFTPTFCRRAIVTSKVLQTDLVLVCNQGSLVGLCMQDYKCLYAADLTICATLVNRQTDVHTHRQTAF